MKDSEEKETISFHGIAYDGVHISMNVTCKPKDREITMQRIRDRLPLTPSAYAIRFPELLYMSGH